MKTSKLLLSILMAGAVLVSLAGCKEGGPSTQIYVKQATGQKMRIAVLPFDNASQDQDAGRIMTTTVVTYLLSTNDYEVVEPGVVYAAMASEGVRLNEGITLDICKKLQPKLNADAFIVGLVEDFGEVRIGPDVYPSVSFSARLVDARTANILWAATISKTGAENVKIFDIGRISSIGKLSKLAVRSMADSLAKSNDVIRSGMMLPPTPQATAAHQGAGSVAVTPPAAGTGITNPTFEPATNSASDQSAKYLDESATYGEKELTALLKDLDNAKLGDVVYKKHFHDWIEAKYTIGNTGKFVEVKLVDYRKPATSEKFLQADHQGDKGSNFESLKSFTSDSEFGYHHLDIVVGRFGLYLRGPKDNQADIESIAKGIINLLK